MANVFATATTERQQVTMVDENILEQFRFIPATSTDLLQPGYAACLDSTLTGDDKFTTIVKPTMLNIDRCVGIVAPQSKNVATGAIARIIPMDKFVPGVYVQCEESITDGDILGVHPETYAFRRGVFFHRWGLVARETVDRSTTAGLVRCDLYPILPAYMIEQYQAEANLPVGVNSLNTITDSAAATHVPLTGGWNFLAASGSCVAVGPGGSLKLTPQATTDNASALLILGPLVTTGPFQCGSAGCPILFDVTVNLTEHDTSKAILFAGLIGTLTASATVPMLDGTAGPSDDYDGFGFHKVEDGTVWLAESAESSGALEETDTDIGAVATGVKVRFTAYYDPKAANIRFYRNGVLVHTSSTRIPISTANLTVCVQVKSGSATGTPNVVISRLRCVQPRTAAIAA